MAATRFECHDCTARFAEPDYADATSGSFMDPMACCPKCRSCDISAERVPSMDEIHAAQDRDAAAFAEFHALPQGERDRLLATAEARIDALRALQDRTTREALATLDLMHEQSLRASQLSADRLAQLNRALDGIVMLARESIECGEQRVAS